MYLDNIDVDNLSPMMRQYVGIKKQYKGILLFFRLGDFYELFFDDAEIASRELEIALTQKSCGNNIKAPMCGVPFRNIDTYVKKLVDLGYKVAICEQGEALSEHTKVVRREVTRIYTPGTLFDSNMLDESKNNYICSLYLKDNKFGISFADVSTGIIYATECNSKYVNTDVINELDRFTPSELLHNKEVVDIPEINEFLIQTTKCPGELISEEKYDLEFDRDIVIKQFGRFPQKLEGHPLCLKAVGALLDYLDYTQKEGTKRMTTIRFYNDTQFMDLDYSARRNLELTQTIMRGEKNGSLLGILDKTKTSMGKRLMRNLIEQPLLNVDMIEKRHEAVSDFLNHIMGRDSIREILSAVYDIERLTTKAVYGNISPREMKALGYTISNLTPIKNLLNKFKSPLINTLNQRIKPLNELSDLIDNALVDEPSQSVKDGGFIKEGFDDTLDEIRSVLNHGKGIIAKIEAKERERTNIPKLKISYNKVFGYYIEVTKSYKDNVPKDYIRKQTLTGSERYITPELKEYEENILTAGERSIALEQEIFLKLRKKVIDFMPALQLTSESIAMIDVLISFSIVSQQNRYTRPIINNNGILDIKDGRHPVVETLLDLPFVPNDTYLDLNEHKMMVITGPNMAGKSTYMRQVALIVLMSQIGCFVPATEASLPIVDKLFTRVGASDDLSSGKSTFMVEMSEVAKIISNATQNSLVILDEIGRGTSTFDGMSIAKSVAEYISSKEIGCKTLFATHYHELTSLENEVDGIVNFNIAVKKRGDNITFLRKIVKGGVDDSYGIDVAKLAGIPKKITDRAYEILEGLENGEKEVVKVKKFSQDDVKKLNKRNIESEVEKRLQDTSLDSLTPIECMNLLYMLKKIADNNKNALKDKENDKTYDKS